MSKVQKFSYGLTLLIFVISISFHSFQNEKLIPMLIFSLPILWVLWLYCSFLEAKKSIWMLVALWFFIDITVLAVLSLSVGYAGSHDGPRGDEIVYVIAFLPVFLPVLLISYIPAIGTALSAIGKGAAFLMLGENAINTLPFEWISFSVISAIPSFCFLWFFYVWRRT